MPALTKYGEDVESYVASNDRDVYRRVECRFVATGSSSYYSRSCTKLAAWSEAWIGSDGVARIGDYPQLRCNRHRAIDERTAANRGYGARDYVAFDGRAEAKAREGIVAQAKEMQRLGEVSEKVRESIAYVLKHAVLATDERNSLEQVMADLKKGTLEVR